MSDRLRHIWARAAAVGRWAHGDPTVPQTVLRFLAEDVPVLLRATADPDMPTAGQPPRPVVVYQPDGMGRLVEAVLTPARVIKLVGLARAATSAEDMPGLADALEVDFDALLDSLCPHRMRALAEFAVRALAETNWTGDVEVDEP